MLCEIKNQLKPLQELVSGFDFATVVSRYVEGFQAHNDSLMSSALRWLRAEYRTKTEAKADLDVRSIIDDVQFYDYLKLFASFVRLAGYAGLLINIDEMGVFSHRLNSSQARSANYEVILRILNDCLQGNVAGLGFLFGGTNTFLEDPRRGLFSYEALATRLGDNTFARPGLKDFSGPVIRLQNLSPEDLFVLLHNIRAVFALGDPAKYSIDDEGIKQFMAYCSSTLGAEFFLTPRDAVKAFVGLLSVIDQNPGTNWATILRESHSIGPPIPKLVLPSQTKSTRPARLQGARRSELLPTLRRRSHATRKLPKRVGRLHPPLQEALYRMRWTKLRQIQVDAIHEVLDGDGDLIIAARTAAGKTEAAFLPILSRLLSRATARDSRRLRRPAQGPDQRPVLTPGRVVSRVRDPRPQVAR